MLLSGLLTYLLQAILHLVVCLLTCLLTSLSLACYSLACYSRLSYSLAHSLTVCYPQNSMTRSSECHRVQVQPPGGTECNLLVSSLHTLAWLAAPAAHRTHCNGHSAHSVPRHPGHLGPALQPRHTGLRGSGRCHAHVICWLPHTWLSGLKS